MLISVVVCTYNRNLVLRKTLESLSCQKGIASLLYEVIVVDNNSTDQTKEEVDGFILKDRNLFKYFFVEKQGKPYALNFGISRVSGDWIVFTDDDVIVSEFWISELSKTILTKDKKDVVCGKILPFCNPALPKWCNERRFNAVFGITSYGDKMRYIKEIDPLPSGMNICVKRDVFESVGYFNPNFSGRGEDADFCFRALRAGKKFLYSPDIVSYHNFEIERLNKKQFRDYFYGSGQAKIKRVSNDLFFRRRSLLGIPLWMYKQMFDSIIKIFFYICMNNKKEAFSYELDLFYLAGMLNILNNKKHKKGTPCSR